MKQKEASLGLIPSCQLDTTSQTEQNLWATGIRQGVVERMKRRWLVEKFSWD